MADKDEIGWKVFENFILKDSSKSEVPLIYLTYENLSNVGIQHLYSINSALILNKIKS